MRKKIVVGNWKMNGSLKFGKDLAEEILQQSQGEVSAQIILGAPFTHLSSIAALVEGKEGMAVAAQNCSHQSHGAYTGEISAEMVQSTGAKYVIVGHSERREYFQEDDALLQEKIKRALAHELAPIFCCGEPLVIREQATHFDYVAKQLTASVFPLSREEFAQVIIAYEPIWAIGTGKTATATQAQEMHAHLRHHLATRFGQDLAQNCPILYGGSCKPANAPEIFAQPDVDGGLIGGASLNAQDFLAIVRA